MPIELDRFSAEKEKVLPLVNGGGSFHSRRIYLGVENGWYVVSLGDTVKIKRKATQMEIYKTLEERKCLLCYPLGTSAVPVNFDNFKKKGYQEMIDVQFLDQPIFTVAKVVQWDDGRFYYFEEANHERETLQRIKEAFNNRESLRQGKTTEKRARKIAGVTPELRFYYLLLSIQNQSYEALKELTSPVYASRSSSRQARGIIESFKSNFSDRVTAAVEQAGGTLNRVNRVGTSYLVEWKIGGQIVKSKIRDDLRIISAGFCLSGDDQEHTMNSIVSLAKMFQEEDPLYITRE